DRAIFRLVRLAIFPFKARFILRDGSIVRECKSGNNQRDIIFSRHASCLNSYIYITDLKNANLSELRKNCCLSVLFRTKFSGPRPLRKCPDFEDGNPAGLGRRASCPAIIHEPQQAGSMSARSRLKAHIPKQVATPPP